MKRRALPVLDRAASACRLALVAAFTCAVPAQAMEFIVRPPLILAAGSVDPGDEFTFKKILAAQPADAIKGVMLHSSGGFVRPAGEIGRTIRERGLATLVVARSMRCTSACTIIFASGTRRLYLETGGIADGAVPRASRGLGFHEGSSPGSRQPDQYSGHASAQVIDYFYEFGVPRAKDLITKAGPDAVYVISGRTALDLGIATSLGPDPAPAGGSEQRHRKRP
jgi:hypothetical protein